MMKLMLASFQPRMYTLISNTRLVRLIGTGLTGIGMDNGARMQVMAVIIAISTSLRGEDLPAAFVVFVVLMLFIISCRTEDSTGSFLKDEAGYARNYPAVL